MAEIEEYEFRLLNHTDKLDFLVRMHKTTFYNVLSGQIGEDFLYYFYSLIVDKGFIYGCFRDNELLAFVSGSINEKDLLADKQLSRKAFRGILKSFSPKIILSVFRHLKRGYHLKNINVEAELLSIITSESLRGKGIGIKLLDCFETFLQLKGVKEYKVYTEINVSQGYKFYEKYGFSLLKEMNLFGLKARLYGKQIG